MGAGVGVGVISSVAAFFSNRLMAVRTDGRPLQTTTARLSPPLAEQQRTHLESTAVASGFCVNNRTKINTE
jgi:hypothetical protein